MSLSYVLTLLLASLGAMPTTPASQAQSTADVPIDVELGLYVADVTRIDERNNTFEIELDVVSRFTDSSRAFTPAEGEPRSRQYLQDQANEEISGGFWPAMNAVNAIGNYERVSLNVRHDADGTFTTRGRIRMVARAGLNFRRFPFDRQTLPIHVESTAWNSSIMVARPNTSFSGFDPSFQIPEWRITNFHTESSESQRFDEAAPYSRVSYFIDIQRLSGFYLWKVIIPLFVIVAISWVVFWMSDDPLGRRAGVSATGMLTVIAYQFVISDALPRVPYLTVMDFVTLTSLVFIALTMLMNILITRKQEPENRARLDHACRLIFPFSYSLTMLAIFLGVRA